MRLKSLFLRLFQQKTPDSVIKFLKSRGSADLKKDGRT